jgi:hypothetical protein
MRDDSNPVLLEHAVNYKRFSIQGINPSSGRKKTIKLDVPNITTPSKMALEQETIQEPFEINEIPFEEPTDRQQEYAKGLGIDIPADACKEDVSALISRAVDSDSVPNHGLIEYASNKGLTFSEYIGKKALYNLIFYNLNLNDKIAFFCFSVYRYLSDDRHANLDTSPHRDIFYLFAQQYEGDKNFVSSMEKYEGKDLRYFGKIKIEKGNYVTDITGGSIATTAYKTVSNFLHEKFNTPLTKTKTIQAEAEYGNEQRYNGNTHTGIVFDKKKTNSVLIHILLAVFTLGLGNLVYLACKHWKNWKILHKALFFAGIIFYIIIFAVSVNNKVWKL